VDAVVEEVLEEGIRRHQEIVKAHSDAVMAIAITEDCIYTGSRDKTLKRWKPLPTPSGRFELRPDVEVPLGEQCLCLVVVGEWLFCGLSTGNIRGFAKSGKEMTLTGHTKKCSALLVHQHVLISGGGDATVRCWQMDPATQNFTCTHSITEGIPGSVNSLTALGEYLWIGGTSGVSVVELASLRVVSQLAPKKFVASFLPYEGHIIVSYVDGSSCIFDGQGNQKLQQQPLAAGPVMCMAGLELGPRMLCGHAKGQVSSVELPGFVLRKYWQALERCKVQSIACTPGQDGMFIVGGENGSLQLWQRDPARVACEL